MQARISSNGSLCSLVHAGAEEMRPFLQLVSRMAECYVTCYPNAGLPNGMGGYDETPEMTAEFLRHAR